MKDKDYISEPLNGNSVTEVNSQIVSEEVTYINDSICVEHNIEIGTILCGKYKIISKMKVLTGEADLYVCKYENKEYVAKIYRRKIAIKEEIIEKLKNIDSIYVSRIYETDTYNGYPFEILPYYKNGSLQDKKFDFVYLENCIIPCLNKGLNILHKNGIIHKDLKPSNIMVTDNVNEVAIIDFGISSIKNDGSTFIITHTGMTPEYSAPETFRSLYLEESDYYSLGITLFELFCGYTPYKNMDAEAIEQYVSIQKIPFPETMPKRLKDFISGVTYYDITNRKNKNNPNRRWTYEETAEWCEGKNLPIPGEETQGFSNDETKINPYTFLGKKYTNIPELVYALAYNWEEGKKQLFRGLLSSFFKNLNPEIASFCIDAEEQIFGSNKRNKKDEDYIFFKLLYKLNPHTENFYLKDIVYKNLDFFGKTILEELLKNHEAENSYYDDLLNKGYISYYLKNTNIYKNNEELYNKFKNLEKNHVTLNNDIKNKNINYFLMSYFCSEEKVFYIDGQKIYTIEELIDYMLNLSNTSYEKFEKICLSMIDENNNLNIQLESWLIALGKRTELIEWENKLKAKVN